eukprot:3509893-Pyramimonas_sp.AAC.1
MGNLHKGTLVSLPPRSILGHFRWPLPARGAQEWASAACAPLSRVLTTRADCTSDTKGGTTTPTPTTDWR